VFTTAISRIWLVGLVLFALTPVLIAARPAPFEVQTETQVENAQPAVQDATGKQAAAVDGRDPASAKKADAPLATGN
jgi:hypothetical protein